MRRFLVQIHWSFYASVLTVVLLSGCDNIFGDKKLARCTGKPHTVSSADTLTPFSNSYKLSTPSTDSAILSQSCPATFTFEYGFLAKAAQNKAITSGRNPETLPLASLFHGNLFHVDRSTITFSADKEFIAGISRYTDNSIKDFYVSMTDHGDYTGMSKSGLGIFFIETYLYSANADSSMWVSGTINYFGK